MSTLPQKELLRPDEVAVYLSVTVRTVRRWVQEGRIKGKKVVGQLRIPRQEAIRIQKDL